MPSFGRASRKKLATAHPLQQQLWNEVIKVFDCTILEGHRNKACQNRLFTMKPQRSRCKWPDSKHNTIPSIAIDAAPYYTEKPHVRWNKESLPRWYYFAGVVMGIANRLEIPIRWGGDWDMDTYVKDQKFKDLPHFELTGNFSDKI